MRDFFDLAAEEIDGDIQHRNDVKSFAAASLWREVPQALFDSWPESRQLAYCAARDEHSATQDDIMGAEFYLERARAYKEMMK